MSGNGQHGLYVNSTGDVTIAFANAEKNALNGIYVQMPTNATTAYIYCSRSAYNGQYGLTGNSFDIFNITNLGLEGNGVDGLGLGVFNFSHHVNCNIPLGGAAGDETTFGRIKRVLLKDLGEKIPLECPAYDATLLVLPNGDSVFIPCPLGDDASLDGLNEDELFDALPDDIKFVSGFDLQIANETTPFSIGGQTTNTVDEMMDLSFVVPADKLTSELAIVYWNGIKWTEVPNGTLTEDGKFVASVNFTGTFVLVTK
jgi:hypothetical protein